MDWLQAMDVSLFRWINGGMSNPLFDAVMPFASRNALFYPLAALLAAWLIWKKGRRGRLCVLLVFLAVAVSEAGVAGRLKQVIQRERPVRVLEETHYVKAAGDRGRESMPSSHAANWFAATMVAFIYYRRSIRFMLPAACVVAFSRVYNGAHYPGDVLTGAVLGAGCGAAVAWGADALWRRAGRGWFPLWWRRMPSLIRPEAAEEPAGLPASASDAEALLDRHFLRLGYMLVGVVFLFKLAYLGAGKIELSEDEAYQWLWSKHPALSYYSKPPMIAYLQWLGTHLFGDTELGVRFCSPMIAACMSLLALRFFAREISARLGLVVVLMFNASPLLGVGSTLLTIDPPLVLFWTAAMMAGWRAVQPDGAVRQWVWAGFWLALSFLSKYAALYQLVCWAVFFALWKPARVHLRRPGPYLALAVLAAGFLPVVLWNAQHGWITLTHVGQNAGRSSPWGFTLKYLVEFLAVESVLINPVFFVAAVWAMFGLWQNGRKTPLAMFLFSMGAPVFFGHLLFTLYKRVQPNWMASAVVPMLFLAAVYWHERLRKGMHAAKIKAWLIAGLAVGLTMVAVLHDSNLVRKISGRPLPAKLDPLRRVRAWSDAAAIAERERSRLERESGKPAFILCSHYGITGLFSFYLPEARAAACGKKPLVYCQLGPQPKNQLYFWPEYRYRDHRRGQNAVYVQEISVNDDRPPACPDFVRESFASVGQPELFEVRYRGQVYRRLQIHVCRDLK